MLDESPALRQMTVRLGPSLSRRRLQRQADLVASLVHQGEGALAIERLMPVDRVLTALLQLTGLRRRGRANCLDVRTVVRQQPLLSLPPAFDGFRLLQLSDLHLDLIPGFTDRLVEHLRSIPHDLAVVTGDFADHAAGYFQNCLEDIRRLAKVLAPGPLAILGNHDILEIAPHLEAAGFRVLLNENHSLEINSQRLWFAGIDDPCFYRTHDLAAAARGIPREECSILLSHGPRTYNEAWQQGFDFMLSGHTHGGQICLPGNIALIRNGHCPPAMSAGPWKHHALCGYTSRGTGSCGVAARFNCPPEITVHVLRTARD